MEKKVDTQKVKDVITDSAKKTGSAAVKVIIDTKNAISNITVEDVLRQAMKVPLVKINREKFLRKELIKYFPEDIVNLSIEKNPAFAGVERERVNKIATHIINFESNKVTAISAAAGIPGGAAMAATIPADLTQYFCFILRVMQKLAYLYGFAEFEFSEEEVDDATMNQVLIFLGVMFGAKEANAGIKAIAEAAAKNIAKKLPQKALTKTALFPLIRKIANAVGVKITKQIFADGVAKIVPVLGAVVSGGVTYLTFKPCANQLKNSFKVLSLSDPEFYKKPIENNSNDKFHNVIDVEFSEVDDTKTATQGSEENDSTEEE